MASKTLFGVEGIRIRCRVKDNSVGIRYEINKCFKYKYDNHNDYFI